MYMKYMLAFNQFGLTSCTSEQRCRDCHGFSHSLQTTDTQKDPATVFENIFHRGENAWIFLKSVLSQRCPV